MKSLIILAFVLSSALVTAQNQACEDKWKRVTNVSSSDNWKEINTVTNGKVYWKSITYNRDYVYKLYKVASTGYYYVQDHGFEKMVYYDNERDAIRALYIYACCSGYFTEQGKVK